VPSLLLDRVQPEQVVEKDDLVYALLDAMKEGAGAMIRPESDLVKSMREDTA
jgi:hypothetical protein